MNNINKVAHFVMCRDEFDRRATQLSHPPYMTEEGMVLVDRRVQGERRAELQKSDAGIDVAMLSQMLSCASSSASTYLDK